jgi:hypothetical protein
MKLVDKNLPSAEDFQKKEKEFANLCRSVFSGGLGKDLLEHLERIYCEGKLYQNNDRETVYCVAQRDLILELKHNSIGELK